MKKLLQILTVIFFLITNSYFLASCGMDDPMPCIDNCEEKEEEEEDGDKNGWYSFF